MIKFRKALLHDLDDIFSIIEKAKDLLRKEGLSQWQSGRPSIDTLKQAIKNGTSYVLELEDKIIGTIDLSTYDPCYEKIDGKWLYPEMPYVVIHTLAIHQSHRGAKYGQKLIEHAKNWAKNKNIYQIRIDTHKDNQRMIHLIQKHNFEFAGVVDVDDPIDSKRNAYQCFIKPS